MTRLNITVEGQTEQTFVRDILAEHLLPFHVYAGARRVETGRVRIAGTPGGRRVFRGGMTTYAKARRDILAWIKQESNSSEVYHTTMFDLYALPKDFPAFDDAMRKPIPALRVQALESALENDIGFARFIPYIQLHEFEALVLVDPAKIAAQFEMNPTDRCIRRLEKLARSTPPEEINDGETTAPSKRIASQIPEYEAVKPSAGPQIVQAIGLATVRSKCPHFDAWVKRLENLGQLPGM